MEKLTFYAVSAPEKLDRIGAYLAERLSRDVVRHRYGYVVIAMEALDQLLMACHSQSIKPFVESFLHMVAKLLESREPDLQVLGTNSFVKFANIEEDTPSYHRRYDFFVSQFSAMCHSTHEDPETRTRIRVAGIKGLQGVVRKTVNDELQAIIWEPQHMDKLIPSMLFNMQDAEDLDRCSKIQEVSGSWKSLLRTSIQYFELPITSHGKFPTFKNSHIIETFSGKQSQLSNTTIIKTVSGFLKTN
ncbi:membrane anchoring protein efr3a [Ameca splendens]|uniref:Membrane anchoring protein efr3a n=1 Tax=Ameca splendens TaxID=208324 RepID=A0ABV0Y1J7_9TELE